MPEIDFAALAQFPLGNLSLGALVDAVITLLICLLAVRIISKMVSRILERPEFDPRRKRFTLAGVRTLLYVIVVLIVADSLGIPVTSPVTMLGVFGLAVSLAVQDILANVASGLVILFSKPFMIGDYIESDVGAGTVVAIDLIHTKLDTPDGQRVLLPNSKLAASKITNYTRLGTRRINLSVGISYTADPREVRKACLKAIERTPNVLADPAPAVVLSEFGDSALQFNVRCWTNVENYWDSRGVLTEELKDALDSAGISIPYNQLDVHVVQK